MGILDGLLGQIGSHVDVANLAAKMGLDEEQVEAAIHALGKSHTEKGDTVENAAEKTGLSTDTLSQIVAHIGGEGSLAKFAALIDQDGDGNPINDLMKMAKKFTS